MLFAASCRPNSEYEIVVGREPATSDSTRSVIRNTATAARIIPPQPPILRRRRVGGADGAPSARHGSPGFFRGGTELAILAQYGQPPDRAPSGSGPLLGGHREALVVPPGVVQVEHPGREAL